MKKISIIVPVYKVEPYLRRCVDSILAQTFTDFELILVDDGSPDNCGAICDEYAQKDARVHVIHIKNGGVSRARNAGLDVASGQYITFVDSDDYIDLDYLEHLMDCPRDLTICGTETWEECGRRLEVRRCESEVFDEKDEIDYPKLYRRNMLYSPYCKLLKRDIISKNSIRFRENISWGEDGMFVADYLQYTSSIKCIDYTGYHYVKYPDKETLSTRIKEESIDVIDTTRNHCIEQMKQTSPEHYDEVARIIRDDICLNCKYVLCALICNTKLKKCEKVALLEHFLENRFVHGIVQNLDLYYENQPDMQIILSQSNAARMIETYVRIERKKQLLNRIYTCYEKMPKGIKSLYRQIKRLCR